MNLLHSYRLVPAHRLAILATLALVLPAAAASAQEMPAQERDGYLAYQCVVLGESAACPSRPVPPTARILERVEPGPYARYLMIRLGMGRDAAIAEAASIGERPTRRVVSVTTRVRTDVERYDRWIGHPVAPERSEVILSESVVAQLPIQAPGNDERR